VLDVLPLLNQIATLDHPDNLIEFLDLRQQLADEVLLALFETASTVAELTCERDRTNQIADWMDAIDASRVRGLTIVSVLVGGLASIASFQPQPGGFFTCNTKRVTLHKEMSCFTLGGKKVDLENRDQPMKRNGLLSSSGRAAYTQHQIYERDLQ
jgi:hypothetical protein